MTTTRKIINLGSRDILARFSMILISPQRTERCIPDTTIKNEVPVR